MTTNEDKFMALFCLFEDLNNMHRDISCLWKDYRNHKGDLVSVSLATNAAIEMTETLEFTRHEHYPDFNSAHAIMFAIVRAIIETESTIFCCQILHLEEQYYVPKAFQD